MESTEIGGIIHVKVVGVARCLDNESRLVIPSEFRQQFNLRKNALIEIIGTSEGLLLRPMQPKE